MKIYIEKLPITNLIKIVPSLKKYLVNTKQQLEIISNEGLFYIDDSKAYKITIRDKDVIAHKNYYNNFSLIVDYSYKTTIETNQIPNHNIETLHKYYYFALNKNSKLQFVIQSYSNNVEDFNNIDDFNNIKICDFYFEIKEDIEINNIFLKDEINVFLSLLN